MEFFQAHVIGQFYALKDFHAHSEAQLQESLHTHRSIIGNEVAIPPGADEQEVQRILSEHTTQVNDIEWRYRYLFTRLLRYSVIVMCFSVVESNLSRIAREMSRRNELRLTLEDLQAKDLVKRFQKFWTKVAHLPWWENTGKWSLLKDVQQIRHIIVHRHGVVGEKENRRAQILAHDGVRLLEANDEFADPDDVGTLVLEDRFCQKAIDEMTALIREVLDRPGCFGPVTE